MLEKGRETDAVVGDVRLLTDHEDVELASFGVLLDDFFTTPPSVHAVFLSLSSHTNMNEIATIPSPTTTIFCRRLP